MKSVFQLLIVASSLCSAAAADPVCVATRVQRFAYQTPTEAVKAPLYHLGNVQRNARLETVASGALEVTFTDGSRLTLGASSSMVVDKYVFGGPADDSQTLRFARGIFRFVSGTMHKDQVKLQTPIVSIGIRGTVIKVEVREDGSGKIFFEHGKGFIENHNGQTVDISEGQLVTIATDGTISAPQQQGWNAGDTSVDQGLNAFGQVFGGPGAGSGGSTGVGAQAARDAAAQ